MRIAGTKKGTKSEKTGGGVQLAWNIRDGLLQSPELLKTECGFVIIIKPEGGNTKDRGAANDVDSKLNVF